MKDSNYQSELKSSNVESELKSSNMSNLNRRITRPEPVQVQPISNNPYLKADWNHDGAEQQFINSPSSIQSPDKLDESELFSPGNFKGKRKDRGSVFMLNAS